MGINIFFIFLSIILSFLYFIKLPEVKKIDKKEKLVNFEFDDFTRFLITKKNIKSLIIADKYINYNFADSIENGNILIRKKNFIENILANSILKEKDIVYLTGNVRYFSDNIEISSNFMVYNLKKDIVYNDTSFVAKYDNNTLIGKNFVLDKKKRFFKAKDTKFEIKDY